jgi:hypothetical protein
LYTVGTVFYTALVLPTLGTLSEDTIKLTHHLGEIAIRCLNDEMIVICHLDDFGQYRNKALAILVILIDRSLSVASRGDLIEPA